MKKLMVLLIAAIVGNTMLVAVAHAQDEHSLLLLKNSCPTWVEKVDSIKVDFAITVDANGFVRKQKAELLVRTYEADHCGSIHFYHYQKIRNDVFMLNGVPVEVLLYKPKGQQILVGNSY